MTRASVLASLVFPLLVCHCTSTFADEGPAADPVRWGEPLGGLRVGVSTGTEAVLATEPPRFRIVLQNVSKEKLAIPAVAAYVPAPHEWVKDFRGRPLSPVIERVEGAEAQRVMTGGPDLMKDAAGGGRQGEPRILTLEPGASLELKDVALESHSVAPGHDDYGGKTTLTQWWLLPDSTYRIRFAFQTTAPAKTGQWTGKATSGDVTVRVTRPPVKDKLAASFTLPKREYFIGEPIWVTFTVTNKGDAPASFPAGGDYRGTGRHDRFSFTAALDGGWDAPDPVPPSMMGGGLGGQQTLQPGKTYTERLLLNSFRALTKTGEYVVTARRTLNLSTGAGDAAWREEVLPALKVEQKLNVVLHEDERALAKHVDLLVEWLKGPEAGEARTEMTALAQAKIDGAFPALDTLLRHENPSRLYAVRWVSHYDPRRATPPLLDAAKRGKAEVRSAAVEVLAGWNVPEAGPLVAEALASQDPVERRAAVGVCTRYPAMAKAASAALLPLADDPDDLVRRYVGAAFGETGDPRAIPALRKLLRDTADVHIPMWAAMGLKKLGNTEGVPAIIALLKDPRLQAERGNAVPLLEQLTGKTFKTEEQWLAWWDAEGKAAYTEK